MSSYHIRETERISTAIKALRNKLGQTHGGMARLLGTSLRAYDRWEAGDSIPRGTMLVRILALCPDEETRSLFDAVKSSASQGSVEHRASSPLRRWGPGDRLRMSFRNSCLTSIEIIYESAVLGSQAADERLRSYVTELNREAVILAEGLLETSRPPDVSLQQNAAGKVSGIDPSKITHDRSGITTTVDSTSAKLDGPSEV
jgi:transcriptional regulator with XRE-family HTH domain